MSTGTLAAAASAVFNSAGILSYFANHASVRARSRSRWLSGAVLIAAGLYQLSPLKNICLAQPSKKLDNRFL